MVPRLSTGIGEYREYCHAPRGGLRLRPSPVPHGYKLGGEGFASQIEGHGVEYGLLVSWKTKWPAGRADPEDRQGSFPKARKEDSNVSEHRSILNIEPRLGAQKKRRKKKKRRAQRHSVLPTSMHCRRIFPHKSPTGMYSKRYTSLTHIKLSIFETDRLNMAISHTI